MQRGKINVYCFVCDLILSDFSLLFILNLKGPFWYFRISLEVKEYTFLLFRHLVKLLNTFDLMALLILFNIIIFL